jgi:hypothetical protein
VIRIGGLFRSAIFSFSQNWSSGSRSKNFSSSDIPEEGIDYKQKSKNTQINQVAFLKFEIVKLKLKFGIETYLSVQLQAVGDVFEAESDGVPVSVLMVKSAGESALPLVLLAAAARSSGIVIRLVLVVAATVWVLRAPRSAAPGPPPARPWGICRQFKIIKRIKNFPKKI